MAFEFKHHYIDTDLPGIFYGQTAAADIDGDGLPEFITGRRGEDIYWFDYQSPGRWVRYLLGTESPSDVGIAAADVDGDGRIDFVAGGAWYRHPGDPRARPFERFVFDPELAAVHDVVAADIDGDGRIEILTQSDQNNVRWYRIPADPTAPWERHDIGPSVHAGLAVGDIDGDGDLDIVRSNVWFENVNGDGSRWVEHPLVRGAADVLAGGAQSLRGAAHAQGSSDFSPQPFHFGAPEGWVANATKCVLCDVNRDGHLDIVLTDAEIKGARVYWLENLDGRGGSWKRHVLPHGDEADRGAYHSLIAGDFDGDGDLDIFSCEAEAVPGDRQPRWFLWENVDGRGEHFVEHVILDCGLGGHDAVAGDFDGDGDLDICAKLWLPRPDNANGGRLHADFLENLFRGP